jgi:hypothetical protein
MQWPQTNEPLLSSFQPPSSAWRAVNVDTETINRLYSMKSMLEGDRFSPTTILNGSLIKVDRLFYIHSVKLTIKNRQVEGGQRRQLILMFMWSSIVFFFFFVFVFVFVFFHLRLPIHVVHLGP